MLINKDELSKRIKLATQEAWRRDVHTTVNDMIEFIVKESLSAYTEQLEDYINALEVSVGRLVSELERKIEDTNLTVLEGSYRTNGKDGGLSQPKRGRKASDKTTRDAETRAIS